MTTVDVEDFSKGKGHCYNNALSEKNRFRPNIINKNKCIIGSNTPKLDRNKICIKFITETDIKYVTLNQFV